MADTDIVQVIAEARVDAKSLSEFVFKPAGFVVTRRLAPPINTLEYYLNHFRNVETEGNSAIARANNVISAAQASANTAINNIIIDGNAQISNAISNAGFVQVGTFAAGATLAKRNDVIQAGDGKLYRWGGSLPKTVAASSTPENSGGFGSNTWVEVSDASLSQKLAGLGGASIIGNGVSVFNNMAEFLAAESKIKDGSKVFLVSIYQGLDLEGEGRTYKLSATKVTSAINIATTNGYLTRPFDGKVFIAEFGAVGNNFTLDSLALGNAMYMLRDNNGGILSMGIRCTYSLEGRFLINVSNLDWQLNGSTVICGDFLLRWFPDRLGYTSHKNVKISNGVFKKGDRPITQIQLGLVKVDHIEVVGCTFIEVHYQGHFLDLMGSRYVYFHHNTVLGHSEETPGRPFAEFVQISEAVTSSGAGGVTLTPEERTYWDGTPTTDVYVTHNTFKPYTNPTTGIRTYPPRPVGDHMDSHFNKNIFIEKNHFENITSVYTESTNIRNPIIGLKSIDNTNINLNTFIIDESPNSRVITVATAVGAGAMDVDTHRVRILGNTITSNIKAGDMPDGKNHWLIYVSHYPKSTTNPALDCVIKSNTINATIGVVGGSDCHGIIIRRDINTVNSCVVEDNTISLYGGFTHSVTFGGGKGLEVVKDNKFHGLLNQQTVYFIRRAYEGIHVIIDNNTFYDQWKSVYVRNADVTFFTKNTLNGYAPSSFDGLDGPNDHPDAGTAATIAITNVGVAGDNKLASTGNVILGDPREDPIKINEVFVTPPEWQFNIVP